MINMLKNLMEMVYDIHKKMRHFSREVETIKMSNRKAINNNLISELILSTDISVDCICVKEEW